MKFISVRDFRSKTGEFWKSLEQERDLILTNNGKPVAIVSSVRETDLEYSLKAVRQARALAALERIQMASVKNGLDKMTLKEINAIIDKVRKERRK